MYWGSLFGFPQCKLRLKCNKHIKNTWMDSFIFIVKILREGQTLVNDSYPFVDICCGADNFSNLRRNLNLLEHGYLI